MSEVKQRWTLGGATLLFDRNPCQLVSLVDDAMAIGIRIPIGHELAAHLVDGAHLVVDLVGPAGELCWLAGELDGVVIGPEAVTARIRSAA